jgi:hypothetical protein
MRDWLLKNNLTLKKKIWQTDRFVIFQDQNGKLWRYMPEYKTGWPVTVVQHASRGKP